MARLVRFALLVLALAFLTSRCIFSQESAAKKPTDNAAPERVHKILYLSNLSQPTDLQDVVNALRQILEIQRVQPLPGEQSIVIEGTTEQVAMAEKLAAQIDNDKRRFGGLGYRIDFKIQESEGDKKLHSRLYSLVTETRQTARLSIGKPAPPPVQNQPSPETKPPSDSSDAQSIDCHIFSDQGETLELSVNATFARDTMPEPSGGTSPLFRVRVVVTVELDKPTVISRIDDPDGDRSFTIELTATRIKDRS
jgi:hypothetical protein